MVYNIAYDEESGYIMKEYDSYPITGTDIAENYLSTKFPVLHLQAITTIVNRTFIDPQIINGKLKTIKQQD